MKQLTRMFTRTRRRNRRRSKTGCLGQIVVLLIVYFGSYLLLRGPLPETPLHISHRGGTVSEPENTKAAFQNAIDNGTDQLEFDVQRTSDGVLVVIHDETIDRTTDGTGNVRDLSFDEIRALDAGNGEQVSTFEEIIQMAKEYDVGIFPEAKSPELYPGIELEIMAIIAKNAYIEQTVIQSFDPAILVDIKETNSLFNVCTLTGLWEFNFNMPDPENGDAICPLAEMTLLFPWMIRNAHENGREVYVYFGELENPIIIQILIQFGVDGFMVDDPAGLTSVLNP